jgi:hypothetical protein
MGSKHGDDRERSPALGDACRRLGGAKAAADCKRGALCRAGFEFLMKLSSASDRKQKAEQKTIRQNCRCVN